MQSPQEDEPTAQRGVQVRMVAYGSPAYDALVQLRRNVLRLPLGLDLTPQQLASEHDCIHFGAYDGTGRLVGTALMDLLPDGHTAQMRQVAVAPECQRTGVGRAVIERFEAEAASRGLDTIILHAREAAIPFYESLGYEAEGESFVEVTLPHRTMRKTLRG